MFSKVYMAVSRGELSNTLQNPIAYMALHFSPYGAGLSNAPQNLPENSLLLLDDSMPISHHSGDTVSSQLREIVAQFSPKAVILDFQRSPCEESEIMACSLLESLPCPVAATKHYAKTYGCPVFLPPLPVNKPLEKHLYPWLEQGVYLEIAAETMAFTITENGATTTPSCTGEHLPIADSRFLCHYDTKTFPDKVVFTVGRNKQDLARLFEDAYQLGVHAVVGLYQELSRL